MTIMSIHKITRDNDGHRNTNSYISFRVLVYQITPIFLSYNFKENGTTKPRKPPTHNSPSLQAHRYRSRRMNALSYRSEEKRQICNRPHRDKTKRKEPKGQD